MPRIRFFTRSAGIWMLVLAAGLAGPASQAQVAPTAAEASGVNDRLQLALAEAEMRRRTNEALLRSGVILAGAAAVAKNPNDFTNQDDGILTAYEAADLDLSGTGLVVLSACETGLGELLNGQGVYGLQRAFLQAGASSVIMSLWKVNDESTKELMIGFYREWLRHPEGNKQEALRMAQLRLREQYSHPFFWGPFVMVGK